MFVAGDDIDHRSAYLPPPASASAYEGRQMGRLLREQLGGKAPVALGVLDELMPALAANGDDLHYLGALFDELGGGRTQELTAEILDAHAEVNGSTFDPARPDAIDEEVGRAAVAHLAPINEALAFVLERMGAPGGVGAAFVEEYSPAAPGDDAIDAGLLERGLERLATAEDELTAAGFTLSVVDSTVKTLAEGERLADSRLTANTLVVLKHGGRAVGCVSVLGLLAQLDEGDGGDKVAIGAQVGLSVVSTFVSGPVGWAATTTLLMIWLFSKAGPSRVPAVDRNRYFDRDHPNGTYRHAGLTPYHDAAGGVVTP